MQNTGYWKLTGILTGTLFILMMAGSFDSLYANDFGNPYATFYRDYTSSRYNDFDDDWEWDDWDGERNEFEARYNRVEGLYSGMKLNPEPVRRKYPDRVVLYGSVGYSFGLKDIEYQAGLEKGIGDDFRFALGGEYHNWVDSPDKWIIPDDENSLAAVFLKEDFHDYYKAEGSSVYMTQNFSQAVRFKVGYHIDELDTLERTSSWAIFGGSKKFPENPVMDHAENRSVIASLEIDTRNSRRKTTRGWYVYLEYEKADPELKGDYEFDRAWFDIRRFQPLGYGDGIDFRVAGGTGGINMPYHRKFWLGGLSTLRGFPFKSFPDGRFNCGGNRMLLGQIEYRLGDQNMLFDDMGLDFLDAFEVVLFADAGWVWREYTNDMGFDDLDWDDFKSDVGLALTNHGGNVRLQIARRTDTNHNPFTVTFRINRPF